MRSYRFAGRYMAVFLLATLAIVSAAATAGAATTLSVEERRASDLVAASRKDAGRPALAVCADLTEIARSWSRQMASSGQLAHNPEARDQISGWSAWAENVGYGASVDIVDGAFLRSSGHRANILSTNFAHVGIGVVERDGRQWVTQVFRRPSSGQGCQLVALPETAPTPERLPENVERIDGANRYETATALSQSTYKQASTVIVASAKRFPDAMAAAPLSTKLSAPVLLTGSDVLKWTTEQEIVRLGASKAIVLGSEATLSAQVTSDLQELGLHVERLSGANRYETAANIAERVGGRKAVIARGNATGWADTIAATGYAAFRGLPVLLTDGERIDPATWRALERLKVEHVDIVGGTSAVSTDVESRLRSAGMATRRLAGDDRLATSAEVADASVAAGMSPQQVWLATSRNWSDALSAGPAVARAGGVLLLANPARVSTREATGQWLGKQGGKVDNVILVGGPAAIDDQVGHDVAKILGH